MEGSEVGTPSTKTYTEIFEEAFPYYLSIGMPYDLYWHGEPFLVKAYREAEELRVDRMNYEKWLQGLYVYQAVSRVAPLLVPFAKHPKAEPYLDKPIPLTEEEAKRESKQAVENKGIAYMKAKMIEINKKFGLKE